MKDRCVAAATTVPPYTTKGLLHDGCTRAGRKFSSVRVLLRLQWRCICDLKSSIGQVESGGRARGVSVLDGLEHQLDAGAREDGDVEQQKAEGGLEVEKGGSEEGAWDEGGRSGNRNGAELYIVGSIVHARPAYTTASGKPQVTLHFGLSFFTADVRATVAFVHMTHIPAHLLTSDRPALAVLGNASRLRYKQKLAA